MVNESEKGLQEAEMEEKFADSFRIKSKRWFSLFFVTASVLILSLSLILKYISTYEAFILFILLMILSVILLLINNSLVYRIYRRRYYEEWKREKADKAD